MGVDIMNRKLKNFIIKCAADDQPLTDLLLTGTIAGMGSTLGTKLVQKSSEQSGAAIEALKALRAKRNAVTSEDITKVLETATKQEANKNPLTKLLQKSPGVKKLIGSLSKHPLLTMLGSGIAGGGVAYGLSRAFKGE